MRKILFLTAVIMVFSSSFAATNVTIKPRLKASEFFIPLGNGEKISLLDLSQIRIKDVELLTGKKMKFSDKVAFKAAQVQLQKSITRDGYVDSRKLIRQHKKFDGTTGFHLGGFALGFLLGIIGVIIAYLIKDEKKSNRVKWAWIGFVIQAVIGLISLLV